jgi:hypothetical protein
MLRIAPEWRLLMDCFVASLFAKTQKKRHGRAEAQSASSR